MKAFFEDTDHRKGNEAFVAYRFSKPSFKFRWHYHPAYELTLITRGKGRRLVGDSYEDFAAGDLVLLGPNLPHTWVSNKTRKREEVSAVVIQFSEEFLNSFLRFHEFRKVALMLSGASRGLWFSAHDLTTEILRLPDKSGIAKLAAFFLILQKLTLEKPRKLASEYYRAVRGTEYEKRINTVCQYLQKNFSDRIDLDKAAALVHLSRSAFCKFFKRATGKTFTDYINDIRIGNVCQMLVESDMRINEIAYRSGFESLTYFNRVFVRKKKLTPRRFREQMKR